AKFAEELAEFHQAIDQEGKDEQLSELGDLLFTLINVARWYDLDPATALQDTNQRFIQRLSGMESIATRSLSEYTLDELEQLWQQAKAALKQSQMKERGE
ncbi:MAG: MazG nucleotide pyrophosphohydrolase domain-containing protein, partial [Coleofasciculus sp.]